MTLPRKCVGRSFDDVETAVQRPVRIGETDGAYIHSLTGRGLVSCEGPNLAIGISSLALLQPSSDPCLVGRTY